MNHETDSRGSAAPKPAADRPAGEAELYARLLQRAGAVSLAGCDGCTACATRCIDGIDLSYPEFASLTELLVSLPPDERARVLCQDKTLQWWEDVTIALCPFLDRETDLCILYEARPLICRLFGVAAWLPCPTGRAADTLADAVAILQEYAALERHPLREWLARTGMRIPGLDGAPD